MGHVKLISFDFLAEVGEE